VTADTIYIFGGSSNSVQALETIEQYSVAANRWNTISVAMPIGLCFLTTFKLILQLIFILHFKKRSLTGLITPLNILNLN
jgi:N-acetylneuraminic acid mutarotase